MKILLIFLSLLFFQSISSNGVTQNKEESIKLYDIRGSIRFRVKAPNGSFVGPRLSRQEKLNVISNLEILLTGNHRIQRVPVQSTIPRYLDEPIDDKNGDAYFVLQQLPPGAYLLTVQSPHYHFPVVRVDISRRHHGRVRAHYQHDTRPLPYPLILTPVSEVLYFEVFVVFCNVKNFGKPPKKFSILSLILGNTMMWIIGGMFLLMQCTQSLTQDPEVLKELNPELNSPTAPANILKSFSGKTPRTESNSVDSSQ